MKESSENDKESCNLQISPIPLWTENTLENHLKVFQEEPFSMLFSSSSKFNDDHENKY